jgi:hypothetical protein
LFTVAFAAANVIQASAATLTPPNARLSAIYGRIPLSFEANQGQVDETVKFVSHGHGYSLFLTPHEAVLGLTHRTSDSAVLRWHVVGAKPDPRVSGESALETKSNYFRGNDPAKWRTGVANFAQVRYESILPGVDLVYHGNQRQIEYDFVVAPGTSPNDIGVAFDGARSMEIGPHGELVLHTKDGDLVQNAPVIYQDVDGTRRTIDGRYAIEGENRIGFVVGNYDRSEPLVIDPTLAYSTYLGGDDLDEGLALTVDSSGNVYLTGLTVSTNFPTVSGSSLQASPGGDYDGYVAKINSTGTAIVWSTYLGGSGGNEFGQAIAVDASGYVYVAGSTNSTDFPGVGSSSLQSAYGGDWRDMFLVKLVPDGSSLVYSTYIGGNGDENVGNIRVDSSGGVYVSGQTGSTNFPGVTSSSIQSTNAGGYEGVLFHVNSGATAIDWATYLGGTGDDDGCGAMALDGSNNVYVVCTGTSPTFAGVNSNSLQPKNGGSDDMVILEVASGGSSILAGTFFGGSDDEYADGVGLDGSGNVYVAGTTFSTDFPGVAGSSFQSSNAGGYDATLTKFNSSLSSVIYSTYIGGSGDEFAEGLAVDAAGNCYVAGSTGSTTFPGVNSDSIQSTNGGGPADVFAFVMNPSGTDMVMSTFLGGSDDDEAIGLAIDGSGGFYLAGCTTSTDYPISSGVFQTTYGGGGRDAFISKIDFN